MKVTTLYSPKYQVIPLEKQKLLISAGYGLLAVLALALVVWLEQFGLPEELKFLAPMLPVIINFLKKWAGENTYVVKQ